MKNLLPALIFVSLASQAQQVIPDFTLINARIGDSVSLSEYAKTSAIVIIFASNVCPYDNYYQLRIKELVNTYSGKIQFVLINSNAAPEESISKMTLHYPDLDVPYLADKDQKIMALFGARKSPEVFLLKPDRSKFIVEYSGAIDDNPQVAKDTKQNYLQDAIRKLLAGEKIEITSTRVVGCTITQP